MQVDVSTVMSIFSGIVSVAFALYLAIAKYAIGQREKEIDRRLDEHQGVHTRAVAECAAETRKLADRLTGVEKEAIHQEGLIKLVQANHDGLLSDIEEIKRTMCTKSEFDARMTNIERTQNQILAELRGGSSRYASHGSVPVQSPYPKKEPR